LVKIVIAIVLLTALLFVELFL